MTRLLGHPRTVLIATTVLAVLAPAAVLTASPAQARRADTFPVSPTSTVTISGHGFGHGHGMSQWGAQGAGLQGLDYRAILDFYYPGTQRGSSSGKVSVLVSADTSSDVVVAATPALVVRSLSKAKTFKVAELRPGASAWKLEPTRVGTRVRYRTDRWRTLTRFKGDAEFSARGRPMTLKVPGDKVAYRGRLRSIAGDTVNVVSLDSYLRGVVPREVPAQWTPAAVQAQSVAARTYAAYERANVSTARHFQLYDTTRSQVYGGVDAEQPGSDAAIKATRKQIVTYADQPAFTQFSASNGGWSSAGSQPYLVAKQDPYDAAGGTNPHANWTAVTTGARLQALYPRIGAISRLDIGARDGNGDFGGRADSVTLTGSNGPGAAVTVGGENFRFALGLKSDWFTFTIS